MQFNILGPLEVVHNGTRLPLKGSKQRALLGFLLLHDNEVIATSRLLRALWPGQTPTTARKMVQNAVSGLRGVLAATHSSIDSPVLLTHAPGYLLRVDPGRIDRFRFDVLVRAARSALHDGRSAEAARRFREALALWRGPALSDVAETGVVWPELGSLRDKWLSALEDCFGAELSCGRHHEVLGPLEELLDAEPHRERLCHHLMTALYRCGRQVEALRVYRRTRQVLVDSLGLEPGRELQELQHAILDHSTALNRTETIHLPTERTLVSVLAVAGAEQIEATVREEVEQSGGTVLGTVGSVLLSAWGVRRTKEFDAAVTVQAALAIRDRLALTWPVTEVRTVVDTGEVAVRYPHGEQAAPVLTGDVIARCLRLVSVVEAGGMWVSDTTRLAATVWSTEDRSTEDGTGEEAVDHTEVAAGPDLVVDVLADRQVQGRQPER
jgi:DNA-binding SARP family transcriptional activator